jgi:prophage tail gpP-like protein
MSDKIELRINGKSIQDFVSYSIDSDLTQSACAFSLDLSNPDLTVFVGSQCEIYINGILELIGIIDSVETSIDKQSSSLNVSGRDLMCLLVDSCAEVSNSGPLEAASVVTAAKQLTAKLPFINRKKIILQEGCFGTPIGIMQIEPGAKIFDILQRYASMRALIFYSLPDGTMVFGKPRTRPKADEPKMAIIHRLNGIGNNAKSCKKKEDIANSYSHVFVISQSSGGTGGSFDASDISATRANPDFPKNFYKPLVVTQNGDLESPASLAKLLVERMRKESLSLEYTVDGHSQNSANWRINQFCSIIDEKQNIKGDFLLYGRTFTKSKMEGTQTILRLGRGGIE